MKQEKAGWVYGESYLILDRPLSCVVNKLASGVSVLRNWQAKRIEYGGCGGRGQGKRCCRVVRENGDVVECDAVIVTVPLTILKAGDIAFSPPLPSEKLGAISRIGMSTAVKVCLVFKHQFWPENFWDACCPFGFLPEIWATKYPSQGQEEGGGKVAMVGFVAGDRAEEMARLSQDVVVASSLAQLDEMFASAIDPSPATSSFHSCYVKNWSDEPFIRGAYSYPSRARAGDRKALAQPVGSSLFFAGEATHEAVNPCMQGALETAERAVAELMKTVDLRKRRESKL
uniref:Amine oxidase domain-containing protein n=1 Tax=Chloropicon laureae TaxID=464258 RepID=A0A7S3E4S6_9CHLO